MIKLRAPSKTLYTNTTLPAWMEYEQKFGIFIVWIGCAYDGVALTWTGGGVAWLTPPNRNTPIRQLGSFMASVEVIIYLVTSDI